MFSFSKKELLSLGLSILILGCLLLTLQFLHLSFIKPAEDEDGIMGVTVMYGNVEDAAGDTEALGVNIDQNSEADANDLNIQNDQLVEEIADSRNSNDLDNHNDVVVQSNEQTVAVKTTTKKENQEDKLAKEKALQEAKEKAKREQLEKEKQREKDKINNQMLAAFGSSGGTSGGSRGNTQGTGVQGVTTGNASTGATTGIGGSYSLSGRTLGKGGLIKPKYTVDDYGKVVIDIVVDAKGNVIEALIGKGSNITSAELINEALKAAKKTKFNEINTLVNQKGTITFVYGYE